MKNMGHYGTWTKNMGQLWDIEKKYGTIMGHAQKTLKNVLKLFYILWK